MTTHYTSASHDQNENGDFDNIIRINGNSESDFEEEDYDFDYDPNEMYYALQNERN